MGSGVENLGSGLRRLNPGLGSGDGIRIRGWDPGVGSRWDPVFMGSGVKNLGSGGRVRGWDPGGIRGRGI